MVISTEHPSLKRVNGNGKPHVKIELPWSATRDLHPLLQYLPDLPEHDLKAMVSDIARDGTTPPFLRTGGFIIDNRDRYLACKIAKVAVRFCEWDESGSLAETVARLNLPRLHLTDSQRAAIAVPIAEQITAENSARTSGLLRDKWRRQADSEIASKTAIKENATVGLKLAPRGNGSESEAVGEGGDYSRASERAGNICHVSPAYVKIAQQIRRESSALFADVLSGKFNLSQARIQLHKNNSVKKLVGNYEKLPRRKFIDDLIVTGDCLKVMPTLPRAKCALIIADPPYNQGEVYDYDDTKDNLPTGKYLEWCRKWMTECARLLTPNGSMFVIINDNYSDYFGMALRQLKDPPLYRRETMVWYEGFSQHQTTKFTVATRYIHYFTRSPKGFVWNKDEILVPSARQTVYKDRRANLEGKVPDNIWQFSRQVGSSLDAMGFEDHPPQIPDDLLKQIILVASNPGDLVFDPFVGNGTTIKAALALGREAKGIERSPLYAKQARQWIAAAAAPAEKPKKRKRLEPFGFDVMVLHEIEKNLPNHSDDRFLSVQMGKPEGEIHRATCSLRSKGWITTSMAGMHKPTEAEVGK